MRLRRSHIAARPQRIRNAQTDANPPHRRTARACEVRHGIARGKRDAEIAALPGNAVGTVGKHVENTLRKLRVPTRTAAVAVAGR